MDVDFNLQQYLSEMRAEGREDRKELATKIDEGFAKAQEEVLAHERLDVTRFGSLELRLRSIEATDRTLKWAGRGLLVTVGGFVVDVFKNHLHIFSK